MDSPETTEYPPFTVQYNYQNTFWGFFGGYYVNDDNARPRECSSHKYKEVLLVGVHTYWQCINCDHNINFKDITSNDVIISRISMHKLPWE